MPKLELATIEFKITVKDGKFCYDTPRLNIIQDNTIEILPIIPNGTYVWTATLDIDEAEKFTNNI